MTKQGTKEKLQMANAHMINIILLLIKKNQINNKLALLIKFTNMFVIISSKVKEKQLLMGMLIRNINDSNNSNKHF